MEYEEAWNYSGAQKQRDLVKFVECLGILGPGIYKSPSLLVTPGPRMCPCASSLVIADQLILVLKLNNIYTIQLVRQLQIICSSYKFAVFL